MKITRQETNCRTGEIRTWEEYVSDGSHLTEAEAKEQDRLQAIRDENAAIQAQLAAADLTIIRALVENDQPRIAAHKASQAVLRAKIKPVA